MKKSLQPGITHQFNFNVSDKKVVPALYPESKEFLAMPHVFATGYMVGLIEWTCIQAINPYLDWPREMTVGTHINVSHIAATPPGLSVQVDVTLVAVEGRRLLFKVNAKDDVDQISSGTHERFIIYPETFNEKVRLKAASKKTH